MATLCDVFVMDAFGTAHRAQASTNGVARHAPVACAGPLLVAELEALAAALESPKRPVFAIIGGSKVSTKIEVLQSFEQQGRRADFGRRHREHGARGLRLPRRQVASRGGHGRLREEAARRQVRQGERCRCPTDVVVATSLEPSSRGKVKRTKDVAADEMILDIGPETAALYAERLDERGHDRLERPGRRIRASRVRRPDAPRGGSRRSERSVLDCGRRRHARGNRAVRGRATASRTSRRAAARSSSSSKARSCRRLRRSRSARSAERRGASPSNSSVTREPNRRSES